MTLAHLFGEDGYLVDAELDLVDDVPVPRPWSASVREIVAVLGGRSEPRRRLLAHLQGFLLWFDGALVDDPHREVWLRGEFAATLWDDVEDLDIVVHYDSRLLSPGDVWVLTMLSAEPRSMHPGRILVTALRHDGPDYDDDRRQEIGRSMVAVRHHADGEQVRTGWLTIATREGENGG